jgi:carbonic anhydrase/acetyltransferase-like protein (isoleucine patch superfamily)
MTLYALDHLHPEIHETAWVADSAQLIGRVLLEAEASVWFGVIARADSGDAMRIGRGSNVQEASVLHADPGIPLTIGNNVSVGHKAMLHGCTVGDGSLIGMGAIVLNRVVIGRHCLVGAGALLTQGKAFPDGAMILGSPAKVVKMLSPEEIEGLARTAAHYRANAQRFRLGLKAMGPQ